MKVALWAEIRRLSEIEKLSGWAIARRLHCSRHTVAAALKLEQPPSSQAARRTSVLDPYVEQIKNLLAKHPDLSAVRIREEIARGPEGYTGSACVLRRYLRKVRPARGRAPPNVAAAIACVAALWPVGCPSFTSRSPALLTPAGGKLKAARPRSRVRADRS